MPSARARPARPRPAPRNRQQRQKPPKNAENGPKSHENSQKLSQTPKSINLHINTTIQQQNPLNPLIKPQLNHVISTQNLKFVLSPNPMQKHFKTSRKTYQMAGEDDQRLYQPSRHVLHPSKSLNPASLTISP